ncbi:MAG: hypothetical protein ACTSRA_20680 [Promethearchaeota archaeon]
MSNQHDADSTSRIDLAQERIEKTREKIQKMLEEKKYKDLLNLSFRILQERDRVLMVDALNAIRNVTAEKPRILSKKQIKKLMSFSIKTRGFAPAGHVI